MSKRPVSLLHRTEGAAAIEYAIVLPVLIWLIMGILEYSLVMYASAVLEGATNYAARLGKTGYVNDTGGSSGTSASGACSLGTSSSGPSSQTQGQYILCILQTRVSGLLQAQNIQLSTSTFGSYSIGSMPSFTSCSNTPPYTAGNPQCTGGTQGQIVVYTAQYRWPIYTPLLASIIGTGGFVTLSSSAVVKNEPYGSR